MDTSFESTLEQAKTIRRHFVELNKKAHDTLESFYYHSPRTQKGFRKLNQLILLRGVTQELVHQAINDVQDLEHSKDNAKQLTKT